MSMSLCGPFEKTPIEQLDRHGQFPLLTRVIRFAHGSSVIPQGRVRTIVIIGLIVRVASAKIRTVDLSERTIRLRKPLSPEAI